MERESRRSRDEFVDQLCGFASDFRTWGLAVRSKYLAT
jgi:hypothetical protein